MSQLLFGHSMARAQATSWNGSITSLWHDAANWSNGVPGQTTSTLVSAGAPAAFDILITQPITGDTARTGSLTLQNPGRIRIDPEPAPGALVVHGKTQILNGGGIFVRSGRIEFRDDVRVNNGGVLNCGSGTVLFSGRKFEVAAGAIFVVDGSMMEFDGAASSSIDGNVQLARLRVKNRDTLFITNNVHVVESVEIDSGRTVFVRTSGLLTVDGAITGGGSIVYEASLPVQLSAFSAASGPEGVTLRWSTATEVNNAGWEVERRAIANRELPISNYQKIGFIQGAGTSSSPRTYMFTDDISQFPILISHSRLAYRLKQIDRDGAVSHSWESEVELFVPAVVQLEQNFPNPFNPSTSFRFTVPIAGEARLVIVDILGRTVAEPYRGHASPGAIRQVTWDAHGIPSGVYVARLTVGASSSVRRIVLSR